MIKNKENNVPIEELIHSFNHKKDELKQIKSDMEEINIKMNEMLKTNPKFFSQISDKEKGQRLILAKKIKHLEILECDVREEINQLALKISEKKKSKND